MFAANQTQLQTSVFFTSETIYNFNVGFSNYKTDILLSLGLWQYWWWFWFAVLWSMYYLVAMKLVKARVFKMHARMNTSLRAHGKWGDFLVAVLPLSWCCSILLNSTQILRMLEWQSEVNVMILRIHGKQWYWVYKLDQRNIISVRGVARNAGKNRWWVNTNDDYSLGLCYIAEPTIKVQHEWTKAYKKKLKKKNIGFGIASNYYNNYFLNFAPKPAKTTDGLHYALFPDKATKFRYARFVGTGYYLPHPALTFDFGSGILYNFLNQNNYLFCNNSKILQKKLVILWATLAGNDSFYTRSYNQNPAAHEFAVRKPYNLRTMQYLNARRLLVAHLKEALVKNYFSVFEYGDIILKKRMKARATFRFSETYAHLKTKQLASDLVPTDFLPNKTGTKNSNVSLANTAASRCALIYVKKIVKNNYYKIAEYAANISFSKKAKTFKFRSPSTAYAHFLTKQQAVNFLSTGSSTSKTVTIYSSPLLAKKLTNKNIANRKRRPVPLSHYLDRKLSPLVAKELADKYIATHKYSAAPLSAYFNKTVKNSFYETAEYLTKAPLNKKTKMFKPYTLTMAYAHFLIKKLTTDFFSTGSSTSKAVTKNPNVFLASRTFSRNIINHKYTAAATPVYVRKILKNNYCRVAEYAANVSLNREAIIPKFRSFSETYTSLQTRQLRKDYHLTVGLIWRVRDIRYFAYWYDKFPHVKYKNESLWRRWRRLFPRLCVATGDPFHTIHEYYTFAEAYSMLHSRKARDDYLTSFSVINRVNRPRRPKYFEFFVKKVSYGYGYIVNYPYLCVPRAFKPIRDKYCYSRYITDYPYLCHPRVVNVSEDFKNNFVVNFQFFYSILRDKRPVITGAPSFTEMFATIKIKQVNPYYFKKLFTTRKFFDQNPTNNPYLCLPRVYKAIEDFKKNSTISLKSVENLKKNLAQTKNTAFFPFFSWSEPYVRLLVAKMENNYRSAYRQDLLHSIVTIGNINFFKKINPNLLYGKFEILHKTNVRPYLQHYFSDVIDDMWDVVSRAIPADPVGPFRVIKSVINNINYTDTTETIRHKFFDINDNFFLKYMTDNEEFWLMYTRAQHRYSPAKGYDKKMAEVKPLYVNPIVHSRFVENSATSIKKKTSDVNNFEIPDFRSRSVWETWNTKQYLRKLTASSLDSEPVKLHNVVIHARKRTEMVPEALASRLLRVRRPLIIPAHVNIGIVTNSYDVVHSWFIPGLGIKLDCVPGRSTHHTLYVDNAGHYYGQCAEICGRYHHHMPIRVCALPFEHFLVWWHRKGLALLLKPIVKPNLPEDEKVRLLKKFRRIALERHAW